MFAEGAGGEAGAEGGSEASMENMKIYVETSCLRSNFRHPDPKSQKELAALEQLAERYSLFGSRLPFGK